MYNEEIRSTFRIGLKQRVQEGFQGDVEFDIPIFHKDFGSARIQGKFPRILTKFCWENVRSEDFDILEDNLMEWMKEHFDISNQQAYFETIAKTTIQLISVTESWAEDQSEKINLLAKIIVWFVIIDDVLEEVVKTQISPKDLDFELTKLLQLMKLDKDALKLEPSTDKQFHSLFTSFKSLKDQFLKFVPDYENQVKPFLHFRKKYFEVMCFELVKPKNQYFSEETFRHYRNICADVIGIIALYALIHGITLPKRVLASPTYERLLGVLNSVGANVNDIFGIEKDFESGEDNILIYKVFVKGDSCEVAIRAVCEKIEDDLCDYIFLKNALRNQFSDYPSLERYFDQADLIIDGQYRFYLLSPRYMINGHGTVTR